MHEIAASHWPNLAVAEEARVGVPPEHFLEKLRIVMPAAKEMPPPPCAGEHQGGKRSLG